MNLPVIWIKKINTRHGKATSRIKAVLLVRDGHWATVQTEDGQRYSVPVTELWASVDATELKPIKESL